MKVRPAEAESFLAAPAEGIHGVLLYGPDSGLVRERAHALTKCIAGRTDDPFLVAELGPADISEDPARLNDEARALPFGGGRRVVRLRAAGDGTANALEGALGALAGAEGPAPSLIVVEAGELTPRSSLRRLFEGAPTAAAVPCYLDEGAGLTRLIADTLAEDGLEAEPDALAWLAANLGADRGVTLSELAKLALYRAGEKAVTLEDCRAVIGDAAAHDIEDAAFAAGEGDAAALETALGRAFQEGINPVSVLRAAQRHFQRLHLVAGRVARGTPLDTAVKGLKPPVFFKLAPRFRAQARAWSPARLATALDLLTEAEIQSKSTGQPERLICRRVLMRIASAARAGRN